MTDDTNEEQPDWLPREEEGIGPKGQQRDVIFASEYPMRVLAGAGTGKTFTMVRKIEHLIDDSEVSPDRVLALTFTNNAADSMREKLHARLGTSGYDVDAYTYHSICNEILQDYAYQAGIDPEFDIASDAEKYSIILDVLDEIEYRSIKPNVYGPDSYGSGAGDALASFISTMKRSGISPEAIDAYLGTVDRLYELSVLPEKIESVANQHLGGRSVATALEGLPAMRDALRSARQEVDETAIEASIAVYLDGLIAVCDSLIEAFRAEVDGGRELPEAAHKVPKYLFGGYSSGAPTGVPDVNLELTTYLEDFIDDCKQARDLVSGYEAYEATMRERGYLDFDDLVVETVELLDSEVGAEIASQWDYVFCDEFQDTDRLQFGLVESLVSEDNLFVVGDDDQAIYEWRGANVANITTELDRVFGDALVDAPLEQNFRSRQPILDLANSALENLNNRTTDKTLTRLDEPDYEGDCVVTIEEAEDEDARVAQLLTAVQNLLSGAADEIDREYDPGDIGLLVRKNKHAQPIIHAFERAGIPYQLAGDLTGDSVGVGTVIAYLKALARPETDEVSWNRVLTMRYRLTDADLRHLNTRDETLVSALLEAPLDEFEEPDRIRTARAHVSRLLDLRDTASLAHLYQELKDVTDIEWHLGEQDRRNLTHLEDVIEQFGDDAVQPLLTGEFIETLRHHDEVFAEHGGTPTDQPELADDAVNVMTIHKSKGLDFPVVLIPRLTAEEWAPGSRDYDALEAALLDGPEVAFTQDFVAKDARETRRVLHVALTRAEDMLVLHGHSEEDGELAGGPMTDFLREMLDGNLPWDPDAAHLPIWQDIHESLPLSATDWTDTLAASVVGQVGGRVTYEGEPLSPDPARDQVLSLGHRLLDGALNVPDANRIQIDSLDGPRTASPRVQHSYTSLKAFEECPRKHYLDYVVNAFDGHAADGDEGQGEGPSQRAIGLLFHDTAEIAAEEDVRTRTEWYGIAERLASQRRAQDALDRVQEAIDRFFELEISEWEIVDAEREFEIPVADNKVVGLIDAVYRTPANELVIIDYKATQRERDIGEDRQLPLYLLACQELYDEPIATAEYAFVGPHGPKLETSSYSAEDLDDVRQELKELLSHVADTNWDEFISGSHCEWCSHNNLPCAPEEPI